MDKPSVTTVPETTAFVPRVRLGVWRSVYSYPSSGRNGTFESEHLVQLHKLNHYLVAESLPDSRSYLLIRLTIDGRIATGSWHEQTDPQGYYQGVTYHGAIQLIVDDGGERLGGKWVGFSKDMSVTSGDWRLEYVGQDPPA